MSIQIQLTDDGITFKISGPHAQKLSEWRSVIDDRVLEYELESGYSLRETKLDTDWLRAAKAARDRGVKLPPWYGVTQGAYVFEFNLTGANAPVRCYNSETTDSLTLSNAQTPSIESKTSQDVRFQVRKQQLRPLLKWGTLSNWRTLPRRCIFQFVPTTVGCIVKVRRLNTGDWIDITDYANW
jgi:hypothetical protein